jgi:hypothetical protein
MRNRGIDYAKVFRGFAQYFQVNSKILSSISPRQLTYKPLLNHHLLLRIIGPSQPYIDRFIK